MRTLTCAVAIVALTCIAASTSRAQGAVVEALDRYARGAHAKAVKLAAGVPDIQQLIEGAESWAGGGADPAEKTSRQRLAAAFLLDVVHASTRRSERLTLVPVSHHDVASHGPARRPIPPRLSDLAAALPAVSWGCTRIAAPGPPDDLERAWWRLSVALLEEASEWRTLLGARVRRGGGKPHPIVALTYREVDEGHLAHARTRLAEEPRFQLAEVVARTAQVMHPPGVALGPISRGLRIEGRVDVLRNLERATREVNGRTVNGLERDFGELLDQPDVAGEAALHIAYLRVLRRDWRDALAHLDRVSELTSDPSLLAVADYLRGWVYERLSRPDEAIVAYRRAHAFAPRSPNLAVLLAAQLFQTDARSEAYAILDAAVQPPGASDLLRVFLDGDARLAGGYVAAIREALR